MAWTLWMLVGATAAHAATELRTLIDSDGNPATGCTVVTAAGTFNGVDLAALTRIDLSASEPVGDVSREICQGGVLVADTGFAPLAPLRWPVGVAAAGEQLDVVESYTRLLAPVGALRLGFVANTTDGSIAPAALLTRNGAPGGGAIQLSASPVAAVPALGTVGFALLVGLLLAATYRYARVRQFAASGAALCLVFVVGLAWAAMVRDGDPSDWSGASPVATASTSAPLQFAAVYARVEGSMLHLRYDLDLGLREGTVRDDDYSATEGAALVVAAPGLLANDALGSPAMQVNEFRVQGSPTATPAGAAVPFAGSTLQVNADGGFVVDAPTEPGLFRFEYRARNRFFAGKWGVATVQVAAGAFCGNGAVNAGEACDDGNTVTEVACSYGTAACTGCNATCTGVVNLTGSYCGDSAVNGPEVCDDGNTTTETSCPYGTPTCTRCNATCSATAQLTGGYCGDSMVSGPEVCDDGNNTTESSCPYGTQNCTRCNATCTAELPLTGGYCGDSMVNGPEVCDDGNIGTETSCPYGVAHCTACNASCSQALNLTGAFCGDGIVNGGEVCDGTPGCTNVCTLQ
ncbi:MULTISPECIES: hypothetical protein [unclassified Acidovorax]|uniref:hypothetical protein n=1 Tax=unclassified Acidovorax TaxID=2684926 RepID=UPI001C4884E7|nr:MULTISPECIES: hypothetical protein [unclassified Acidovorax]MBV7458554.1 hypothetical protein [Acidovorax sp. sif0632]MBV7463624.1 hypothetical protein [Acidovorax sp. sif0613]